MKHFIKLTVSYSIEVKNNGGVTMDYSKLIELLLNKEEEGLNMLIEIHGNLIYRASYKVLNNKNLAEECLNLTLLKIWDGIDKFKGNENLFKNWIFTISKRTAIDMLRKEKAYVSQNVELIDNIYADGDIEAEIIQKEDFKELECTLSKLNENEKKIIVDRYYHDKAVKDIATDLNITPKAASLRINRIINKIKNLYKRGI